MSQIALVQSLYAAFGRGDIATLLSNLYADIDWESYGPTGSYPTLGQRAGKSEVERFFAESAATQDFSDFSPREFYEVGDKVFVLGSYAGRSKRPGMRSPASGRTYSR
jgi:uncharacterized protein